jgi:nitrogen fixation NifU-like protein
MELRLVNRRIEAVAFRGECCAITKATASLLSERIAQLDSDDIAQLQTHFVALVGGKIGNDATLGDLNALAPLANYPARRKCALLPFATLRAALAGTAKTTTEGNS